MKYGALLQRWWSFTRSSAIGLSLIEGFLRRSAPAPSALVEGETQAERYDLVLPAPRERDVAAEGVVDIANPCVRIRQPRGQRYHPSRRDVVPDPGGEPPTVPLQRRAVGHRCVRLRERRTALDDEPMMLRRWVIKQRDREIEYS